MRYSKNKKNVKRNSYKKGGNIVAIGNSPDDRDEQWRNNTLLGNTNIDVDGRRSWEKGIYEQAYNAINTAFNKNKIYHYCLTFMQTFIIECTSLWGALGTCLMRGAYCFHTCMLAFTRKV